MTQYRTKIFRSRVFRIGTLPVAIGFAVLIAVAIGLHICWATIVAVSIFVVAGILAPATNLFYVITDSHGITLQNAFYRSWKKQYGYKDIVMVRIVEEGGTRVTPYLQVITETERSTKLFIGLVAPSDYKAMIDDMRMHTTVQTKNMQQYGIDC